MTVLLIAGSPSERSRTAGFLDAAGQRLATRGVLVDRLRVRDLAPQALMLADLQHRSIAKAVQQVARASVLVIATPIQKAAYSGILKLFLDVLPPAALRGKTVLPLATGDSPLHTLTLDYALRPVLQSLDARLILPCIFAIYSEIVAQPDDGFTLDTVIRERLDAAVDRLITDKLHLSISNAGRFAPFPFSQVQCSV
jgi:FMN reductase